MFKEERIVFRTVFLKRGIVFRKEDVFFKEIDLFKKGSTDVFKKEEGVLLETPPVQRHP